MCILTKLGPVSSRAGRKGRFELTSATRNPEHFTALDQILDGALNLYKFSLASVPSLTGIPVVSPNSGLGLWWPTSNIVRATKRIGMYSHPPSSAANVPSN